MRLHLNASPLRAFYFVKLKIIQIVHITDVDFILFSFCRLQYGPSTEAAAPVWGGGNDVDHEIGQHARSKADFVDPGRKFHIAPVVGFTIGIEIVDSRTDFD